MIILLVGRFVFLGCGFSASRSFFAGCHTRLLRKLAHFGAGWDGSYREIRVVPVDCPICPFLQDKIKFPLSPFPPPKIMRLLNGNQRESFFAIELDAASAERRLPICTPPVSDTRPCRAKSLEGCSTSMHKYGTRETYRPYQRKSVKVSRASLLTAIISNCVNPVFPNFFKT